MISKIRALIALVVSNGLNVTGFFSCHQPHINIATSLSPHAITANPVPKNLRVPNLRWDDAFLPKRPIRHLI